MLRKTVVITLQKKKSKKKSSYPPPHTTIEDTIRHDIAQILLIHKVGTVPRLQLFNCLVGVSVAIKNEVGGWKQKSSEFLKKIHAYCQLVM